MSSLQDKILNYLMKAFPKNMWYNDYTSVDDMAISIATLVGSTTKETYFDGTKDKSYNMEIRAKTTSKDRDKTFNFLYNLCDRLESLETIEGVELLGIRVTSEPHYLETSDDGISFFGVDFVVDVYEK